MLGVKQMAEHLQLVSVETTSYEGMLMNTLLHHPLIKPEIDDVLVLQSFHEVE